MKRWTWYVVAALALGCAGMHLLAGGGGEGPRRMWCYDLNTGELFAAPYGTLPPIAAPSGDLRDAAPGTPAGVEAMVLEPMAGGSPLVAYLLTRLPGSPPPDPAAPEAGIPGLLVSLPDARVWVPDGSRQARTIYDGVAARLGGTPHRQSFPP